MSVGMPTSFSVNGYRQIGSASNGDIAEDHVKILDDKGNERQIAKSSVSVNLALKEALAANGKPDFPELDSKKLKLEHVKAVRGPGDAAVPAEAGNFVQILNEVAAFAYGSREGASGGAGYLGIVDGKVQKLLTHYSERSKAAKRITPTVKGCVNSATDNLRTVLLEMAEKLDDGAEKAEIMRLLAEPNSKNAEALGIRTDLDLISRKEVARIVTLLAQGAEKKFGHAIFSWKGVKAAPTVANTTFAAVFAKAQAYDDNYFLDSRRPLKLKTDYKTENLGRDTSFKFPTKLPKNFRDGLRVYLNRYSATSELLRSVGEGRRQMYLDFLASLEDEIRVPRKPEDVIARLRELVIKASLANGVDIIFSELMDVVDEAGEAYNIDGLDPMGQDLDV